MRDSLNTDDDNELDAPRRIDPEIRALHPGKDDAWLEEAQVNLRRYAEATLRQYERIRQDPEALARFNRLLEELRGSSPGRG